MIHFTHIALACLLYGAVLRDNDAWCVGACLIWGCTTSFSAVPLVDWTAYVRMRVKFQWSKPLFYAGHVALHVLPCLYTCVRPCQADVWHGLVASGVHIAWGALVSNGTGDLGRLYVPLAVPAMWQYLWATTVLTEILVPLWLSPPVPTGHPSSVWGVSSEL